MKGKLIQKLLLKRKLGYLVRAYYSISPTKYYKDDSCWSADLKSNTTEDWGKIVGEFTFTVTDIENYHVDVVFDGAFGGVGDEEFVVGEGVVVISSSLEMLINSCLGGIMVSLIFLKGLDEEALVEFMVEWCEEDEDDDRSGEDDLFN
ncbi:hypothetical protein Tco_0679033 [Tanacetum coccineum]|uniref:Uncharacterized protein n=1 Tax=Tanacetum coccineum TaxID=301880 RepID=A0ABQ4XGY6_9ASTR